MEKIAMVQSMLPDLGAGFISLCLEAFGVSSGRWDQLRMAGMRDMDQTRIIRDGVIAKNLLVAGQH